MRRALAALSALVLGVLLAGPAAAGKAAPCTVVPDPVSISAADPYTVTATGGVPGEFYEVIISQKQDGVTDEGRDWLGAADADGTVTAGFTAYPWVAGDKSGLLVGSASVNVVRYRTGGGPGGGASTLARCGFTVVT